MTAGERTAEGWFARGRAYLDDRINPMLVKDMRLWLRGRLFTWGYLLFIALAVGASVLYTVQARAMGMNGMWLVRIAFGALLFVCGGLVPYLMYDRFRAEIADGADELARQSQMSVRRIARGKVLSVWCASALVVAGAAPAFAAAYLLGGVDMAGLAVLAVELAIPIAFMPCAYLLLVTFGTGALARIVAVLVLVGYAFAAFWTVVATAEIYWMTGGNGLFLAVFFFGWAAGFGGLSWFLYSLAVARLRRTHEWRDEPARAAWLALSAYAALLTAALIVAVLLTENANLSESCMIPPITIMVVSWTFNVAFLLVGLDPSTDRLPRGVLRARCPRQAFFGPGTSRLCACYLLGTAVFVALGGAGLLAAYLPDTGRYFGSLSDGRVFSYLVCGPFFVTALGLAAHVRILAPFAARRGTRLSPTLSVLLTFVASLLPLVLWMLLCGVDDGYEHMPAFLAMWNPVGWGIMEDNGMHFAAAAAPVMTVVCLALLASPAWRAWTSARRDGPAYDALLARRARAGKDAP